MKETIELNGKKYALIAEDATETKDIIRVPDNIEFVTRYATPELSN